MPIEVYSDDDIRKTSDIIVTLDSSRRLYLSKQAQEFFGIKDTVAPFKVYLGYDSVNHRICFAKPEIVKIPGKNPITFGKFRFISARKFIDRFKIDISNAPIHYEYVGKDGDWYCFQERGFAAPDLKNIKG